MRLSVRQVIANMALTATSVIVAILLAEFSCRLLGYTTTPSPLHNTGMVPRFYYKADPVNGHDIAENFTGGSFEFPEYIRTYGPPFTVSSNSLGCRDRSFNTADGYVLLLGDSFTWGYVPLEQTWGAIVERLIGVKTLNCGVGGYGPRHERHKMNAIVAKAGRPRLIVVGYTVGNDLIDDYLYPGRTVIDGYMVNKVVLADAKRGIRTTFSEEELRARLKSVLIQQPAGFIAQVKSVLAEHSVLYDLIRKSTALRHLGASLRLTDPPQVLSSGEVYHSIATYPWLSKAWEQHLENLRQLNFAAKAAGTTMLVVIIPDLVQVYDFMRPKGDTLLYEYPNKRLSEFFEKENIAFVDLLPEFRRYARFAKRPQLDVWEDLYWPHDGHPNVKGNWLTGLLISRYVLQHPFPGLRDKDKRLSDVVQRLSVLPSRPKEVKTISVVTPQ